MPVVSPHRSVLDYKDEDSLVSALKALNMSEDGSSPAPSDWQLSVYDASTTKPQCVEEEASRLQNLRDYHILDSDESQPVLDQLTKQARQEYNVPWVCVSMVDMGRQCFKSLAQDPEMAAATTTTGTIQASETSRQDAFCAHTILRRDDVDPVLEVRDTHQDERFVNNPLVQEGPKLRYYAGAPLISPEGHRLGALCLLDKEPHPQGLSDEEHDHLMALANETVRALVQRRERRKQKQAAATQQQQYQETSNGVNKKRSVDDVRAEKKLASRRTDSISSVEDETEPKKRSRSPVPEAIIMKQDFPLPSPKSALHPDKFLVQLVEAMHGVKLQITPALQLQDYFLKIQEEQMAAYSIQVVSAARENNVDKMRALFAEGGRQALDCYNRFGEGMLNLACRRGFKDMVQFLLQDVQLSVRVSDDYGRTPLHDACWNPEPQLEICSWILQRDPSLFLIADKRGYTPFQYARESDWQTWRDFLFVNREHLQALVQPEIVGRFSS